MQQLLGADAGRLQPLVEGTLRLEAQLLQEERDGRRPTFYTPQQLQDGLRILHTHLSDGRWAMDAAGQWRHAWRFDTGQQQWISAVA